MKHVLIILICTSLLLSCGNSSNNEITKSDSSATKSVDFSKDEQAIKNTVNDAQTKLAAGDTTGFIATLSDDIEIIPGNEPPVRGEAARNWVREVIKANNVQIKPNTNGEVGISGDLGYYRYDFEWTVTPKTGGQPMNEKGSEIVLVRRESSGVWVLIKAIWALLPPAK